MKHTSLLILHIRLCYQRTFIHFAHLQEKQSLVLCIRAFAFPFRHSIGNQLGRTFTFTFPARLFDTMQLFYETLQDTLETWNCERKY